MERGIDMAPLHMVVSNSGKAVSYGPVQYTSTGVVPVDELRKACLERVATIEHYDDREWLDNGTTIGQWRDWFKARKDG